jgi:hypothetical protein
MPSKAGIREDLSFGKRSIDTLRLARDGFVATVPLSTSDENMTAPHTNPQNQACLRSREQPECQQHLEMGTIGLFFSKIEAMQLGPP